MIERDLIGNLRGTSTEPKPIQPIGTLFHETDTGKLFQYHATMGWRRVSALLDADGYLEHNILRPVEPYINTTPPTFDVIITVPATVQMRFVFGSFNLLGMPNILASVAIYIEESAGTAIYKPAFNPNTNKNFITSPFFFIVSAGCRYYFTKGGAPDAMEAIASFSYVDLRD